MKTKRILRWAGAKGALLLGVAAAAVIGGTTTAIVMAAIPDNNGVIHGCYRNSGLFNNGQLRVIDSDDQNCNANETALNWNQSGPAEHNGLLYYHSMPYLLPAGQEVSINSGCGDTIYYAISGGYEAYTNPDLPSANPYYDLKVTAHGPEIYTGNFVEAPTEVTPGTNENAIWVQKFKNTGSQDAYIKTYAVCLRLTAL